VLAAIGEVAIRGVALRPGGPAGFGFVPSGAMPRHRTVFLLPGNPVACLAAYEVFAGPTLRAMGGLPRAWPHAREQGRLARSIASELGRLDYVRVVMRDDGVHPIATSGASILSSTTRADGVVLVPEERSELEAGETVTVLLYG
jgi:molybdopterin molybdotransferase